MDVYENWLDSNANRAYPFEENSDFSCEGGKTLPLRLILDARMCSFGSESLFEVRLLSVIVGDEIEAVFSINGKEYGVRGIGSVVSDFDGMSVKVEFCDELPEAGTYLLANHPKLLASRVVCIPFGVGVDSISDGNCVATGDIYVENGYNTELNVRNGNLSLSVEYGVGKGHGCGSDVIEPAKLYYLNGQKADSNGNIQIKGGSGIQVTTGTYNGIPAVIVTTNSSVNNFVYKANG